MSIVLSGVAKIVWEAALYGCTKCVYKQHTVAHTSSLIRELATQQ